MLDEFFESIECEDDDNCGYLKDKLMPECRNSLSWPTVINGVFTKQDLESKLKQWDTRLDDSFDRQLIRFQKELDDKIVCDVFSRITKNIEGIKSIILTGLPEIFDKYLDQDVYKPEICGEDEVRYNKCLRLMIGNRIESTFELSEVNIKGSLNGVDEFVLNFNCGWDQEHGFSMLFHGFNVKEWGHHSEF